MIENKITHIYLFLMFSGFLFFTGLEGYVNIFDSKYIFFLGLSITYVATSAVFGLSIKKLRIPGIFALLYLLITAISAVASQHFPETLLGYSRHEGLLTIGLYVLVFIFVSHNWKQADYFIPLVSAIMIFASFIVILQIIGYNALDLYPNGINYYEALEKYSGAFLSTVGNSDISSAFFSLMAPFLCIISLERREHRPLTITAAALSLISVFLINVSAGILAMFAVAFILPFVMMPQKRQEIAAILAIITIIAIALIYCLPLKGGMLFELQCILKGNIDPDFGSGRIHIWKEVVKKLQPLLGTGPDTMLLEDIEPFRKIVNGKSIIRRIDIAHNDYLNILFHQGAFALIAYLGLLISLFIKWIKNGRKNPYVTALGAGVFGYCVQTFFSFSACSSAVFFWIFLGMLHAEQDIQNT